jgi:membrane protein DedA with SNARE-associated domain
VPRVLFVATLTQTLLDLAARFGYVVIFFGVGIESMGVPVPGETTLLVGAVLAGHGQLSPYLVGVVGWAGAVIGDNAGYLIGRRFGDRLVSLPGIRRLYRRQHMEAAERFFERRGWLAVFFGRFIAVLRIFAGPLAGIHHMPWPVFVVANAAGAAVWVAVVLTVGLVVGKNIERASGLLTGSGLVGLVAVILMGISIVAWRRIRRQPAGSP